MADTHKCPAPGCDADVQHTRLTCVAHWYTIPKPLRDELWRAWKHGTLAEHVAATNACIAHLEAGAL